MLSIKYEEPTEIEMDGSSKSEQTSENIQLKNQSKSSSLLDDRYISERRQVNRLSTRKEKRVLSLGNVLDNNSNTLFDSPHSVHTRSTTTTTTTSSPASFLSYIDDDYEDFGNSDSEFDGESSFANLGLDEKDGNAEKELQNLIAKQALENFRIRKDSVLGGGPKRMSNLNREPSFRGSLELIEE